MSDLKGVYAAVVTPYDDEGRPSPEQFAACLEYVARRGCHGVLVAGTTGEGPSLSAAERRTLFQTAAESGRGLNVLAGTGAASLEDAAEITRDAFDAGCDAAVIIPPFFYKGASDDGLFDFFAALIRRAVPADGRVLLYHNPVAAPVGVSFDVIRRLLDAFPEQVVGIKDSSQDWDHTRALLETFPGFQVFAGDDRLLQRTLEAGGSGSITLVANAFGDLNRAVFDRCAAEDDAADAQQRLGEAHQQFDGLSRIPAIKALLKAGGVVENASVRPPLRPLTADEEALLKERFMLDREIPRTIHLSDIYAFYAGDEGGHHPASGNHQ